jgi:photosystem II stability/assembly factor-like uncharacterized protein
VLYTQNGGAHWQRVVVSGFDNYGRVEDVDFFDTQLGWAVGQHEFFGGNSGQIVRSTDGGVNWQLQDSRPSVYYHDVEVLDAQTVLALGEVPLGPRIILRTSDGGQSWSDVGPSQAVFRDADFINASIGWAVGGLIYKSTDGGQSWVQQGAAPPDLLYAVSFADALNGWAVGWSSTILHTSDGGQNWHLQSISTTSHVFLDVQAFSPSTALICGADGFVARTDDGGQSWVADVVASSAGTFESLCFLAPDRGWVGGDGIWHSGGTYQAPIAYCTAGTTSHGCVPAISAVGTPSATASSGFSIAVDQVEGQRQGLIFYGTSGRVAVAWGPGSSFLCVKTPTQRTSPRSSAGTLLSCDGVLALDWNSWLQTHPFALGVPFSAGQRVWAQAWFRDPPAAKTTNLSNALEFMLAP